MMKDQKGITLVALVITIIVLLILAGVSIAMLTGDNGLLKRSQESVAETKIAEDREAAALDLNAAYTAYMDAKYVATTPTTLTFLDWLKEDKNKAQYMKDTKHYAYSDTDNTVTTVNTGKSGKVQKATISANGGLSDWVDAK